MENGNECGLLRDSKERMLWLLLGESTVFSFLTWLPPKRCLKLSIWSFSNFWNNGLTYQKRCTELPTDRPGL